ncbi:tRNA lysidine(34) synthetase TilS [Sphingomonas sp. S-NIH.Pt15_0812]|nr:tRNA lysidine(34) synthetase TilS [Sphingomonas sp. S-NIH.Pt15_0812]
MALAVSGGADSMAMLALAVGAFPGRVIAATFDHGLRTASAGEAAMVADWCQANAVPHRTLYPAEPLPRTNVQATARRARYAALLDWAAAAGASVLATAHHADDQAETFLMRANRGSGLAGLAGVRPRRTETLADGRQVMVLRPLLGWRRVELRAVAEGAGLPFVDDPSNGDPRYDRARMRDLLRRQDGIDPAQLARSAGWLAEMDADWRLLADLFWAGRVEQDAPDRLRLCVVGLPRGMRRDLARRAILTTRESAGIAAPGFDMASNIESLLDALDLGRTATQAGLIVKPITDIWIFMPAPPRKTG